MKLRNILPPSYFYFFRFISKTASFQPEWITNYLLTSVILSPLLFNIYTSDQSTTPNIYVADYAADEILIAINKDPNTAFIHLQSHLNAMHNWFLKRLLEINESNIYITTLPSVKKTLLKYIVTIFQF